MKLTDVKLKKVLDKITKHNQEAQKYRQELTDHCEEVYGTDPSDIDNDYFIDSCEAGGYGGMTVAEFKESMKDSIERHNKYK